MKKILILVLWIFLLFSCEENKVNEKKEVKNIEVKNTKNLNYKIEKKDFVKKEKASFDIRLDKKVSNEEIKWIANEIKKNNPWFNRYFIMYYLPNMKLWNWAWATSNFNPDLKIEILWMTKKEENKTKNNLPKWEIIWKWIDNWIIWKTIFIFKKNNKYIKREIYKDGSFWDENLKKEWNKFIYENDFWEYIKIEDNWNLWWYSKTWKFDDIPKLK